jgi:uncharacterized protein YegJ (DUF2314 family)
MKFLALLLAVVCALVVLPVAAQDRPRSSTFIATPDEDPEMDAAISKARADIDRFWQVLESPQNGEQGFAVKRKFVDGLNWEYMWVSLQRRHGGSVVGTIANRPEGLRNVRLGQSVSFPEGEVADWFFFRAGKMYGNYTLRPLLKRMPPDHAAKARAMLAEP